jgi:2-polyprenyl-3-methyl-5-hydroxy-6-metoxy-1,4-benzoquinol methylase
MPGSMQARIFAACLLISACSREPSPAKEAAPPPVPPVEAAVAPAADSQLEKDQNEYVEDIMAFTKTSHDAVRERMKKGSEPLKEEWLTWEKQGAMTEARIAQFYKQTANYIYELGEWHLFVPNKRESDMQLVVDMQKKQPKNILDFGGGVGLMAFPLARAGFDVTIADLDGTSLDFAKFRAEKRGVKMKFWKSDVEPMPPDGKYDVILALDVLEHLPKETLHAIVDKLVKLKHAKTEIIISAPFGRTAVHPMHIDLTEDTKAQVERLKTEVPKD